MATQKTVNVGKIPGKIFELPYKKGWTARDYLEEIEVSDIDKLEVQVNGTKADPDNVVDDSDTVLAVAQVKGN